MWKKSRHCQTRSHFGTLQPYSKIDYMFFLVNLHTIPHYDITIPHNDKAKTGFLEILANVKENYNCLSTFKFSDPLL
jgi:hypothetical protein